MTDKKHQEVHKQGQLRNRKPWKPPYLDGAPVSDGYRQRWLRHRVNGMDDTKNINARLREGWELVDDEHDKVFTLHITETSKLMRVSSAWVTLLARI